MSWTLSRRRFLQGVAAGGLLPASPALAAGRWTIQGASRGSLRLVFYTDVHAVPAEGIPAALSRAAAAINAQQADLVLGGGDLIGGGFAATPAQAAPRWDTYMAMHAAIAGEHHAVIGNHDLVGAAPQDGSPPAEDPRQAYRRRLGVERTYWSLDALGYRFLLLDSMRVSGDAYGYHGWVSEAQQAWIREQLAGLPVETPLVLVLHMPLLTAFYGATEGATAQAPPNRAVVNSVEVLELFAGRNLVLVLQGHLHVSEHIRWRGTSFITGGAVCGNWWRGPYHGTAPGFNVLTLAPDRIAWDYVGYDRAG